jgi:hypothetical protein
VDAGVITIDLEGGRTAFSPGALLRGSVGWSLQSAPADVEVRLFWYTQGKGTQDIKVVKIQRFDAAGTSSRHQFRFKLPDSPYSFSGKLVSLLWAVEAVALPGERSARLGIVLAPEGKEVLLGTIPTDR